MPIRIHLGIEFENKVELSNVKFQHLHAFVFNIFPGDIATIIHESKGFKPFCLWSTDLIYCKSRQVDKFTIIISFIDDSFFPVFSKSILFKEHLVLGNYRVKLKPYSNSYIEIGFDDLLKLQAPEAQYFTFNFKTPVSFKKGKVDYPLPEAKLVFKSLIKKWNFFSKRRVDVDLTEAIERKLTISYFDIKTVRLHIGDGVRAVGFVGKVTYMGKNLTVDEGRWLHILGAFSNFSGVGRKCTMGFGFTNYMGRDRISPVYQKSFHNWLD